MSEKNTNQNQNRSREQRCSRRTTFTIQRRDRELERVCFSKLPKEEQKETGVFIWKSPETIVIPEEIQKIADYKDFEILAYKFLLAKEQRRSPRIVRMGVIQNQIIESTSAPVEDQFQAIAQRVTEMIDIAGQMGVNVLCLQEAWTMPFAFVREKTALVEFAESVDGPSTQLLARLAKKHNMVIVSPILERDDNHGGTIHNTAVVIGNRGNIIGSHRKNHIPRVGDFNESTYYMEGEDGHPVFATEFGNVAINICYGRHHPQTG